MIVFQKFILKYDDINKTIGQEISKEDMILLLNLKLDTSYPKCFDAYYKLLNKKEESYIFKYHLEVYSKLSPFLNKDEKKWLASLI